MNKHTAVFPNGAVATRNSKTRTYTHCVAGLRTAEQQLEQARRSLHYTKIRLREYEADLARIEAGETVNKFLGAEHYRRIVRDAKAAIATLEHAQLSDYEDEWVDLGWCGRIELAMKKAQADSDRYDRIVIIEARVA